MKDLLEKLLYALTCNTRYDKPMDTISCDKPAEMRASDSYTDERSPICKEEYAFSKMAREYPNIPPIEMINLSKRFNASEAQALLLHPAVQSGRRYSALSLREILQPLVITYLPIESTANLSALKEAHFSFRDLSPALLNHKRDGSKDKNSIFQDTPLSSCSSVTGREIKSVLVTYYFFLYSNDIKNTLPYTLWPFKQIFALQHQFNSDAFICVKSSPNLIHLEGSFKQAISISCTTSHSSLDARVDLIAIPEGAIPYAAHSLVIDSRALPKEIISSSPVVTSFEVSVNTDTNTYGS
ncbi:hypothetical protein ACTFIW_012089 [Dictyostelium discoideum]